MGYLAFFERQIIMFIDKSDDTTMEVKNTAITGVSPLAFCPVTKEFKLCRTP